MSALGSKITYKQLLERHVHIRIPMIQRDYAQGRAEEEEVRNKFLDALESALRRPADDRNLPLNLDFIYGSVEGNSDSWFAPLDGQQRLTTLFLLHWYLAWNDGAWASFREMFQVNERSRFSYRVRQSSKEFFDELVTYHPSVRPCDIDSLANMIKNQPWYFRSWERDHTIHSVLGMLEAIHRRFSQTSGLYERLVDDGSPAITFQLLDLKHFGLSDDLYIKMNARGKPLTPFETFKAAYENRLQGEFQGEVRRINDQEFTIADFVARQIDTRWADLFWAHRDKSTNLFDAAVMNLFRAVALATRDPEDTSYGEDVSKLRDGVQPPSYSDFESRGWLDADFTINLICLLESWSGEGGELAVVLPDSRYFNEREIFTTIARRTADLSYAQVVQFAAYVAFIRTYEGSIDPQVFQEWMRIVVNLSNNTNYNESVDLRRSIAGVATLVPYSQAILTHFCASKKPVLGFAEQQVLEEHIKAILILGHPGWRGLIERAEDHGYFRGQIQFLLDFSGVTAALEMQSVTDWDDSLHVLRQAHFQEYLEKAEMMFNSSGLVDVGGRRWERALLSLGDYLLPSALNQCFPVNYSESRATWKRLLRGTTQKIPEPRTILHQLWNRLAVGVPVAQQLDQIIAESANTEPWQYALARTPEAIDECCNSPYKQSIRVCSANEVYLLRTTQMNGFHAELFTFCLYADSLCKLAHEGRLEPLVLLRYEWVDNTIEHPHILLGLFWGECKAHFTIGFRYDQFVIRVLRKPIDDYPAILAVLDTLGFSLLGNYMEVRVHRSDVENVPLSLARELAIATDTSATRS